MSRKEKVAGPPVSDSSMEAIVKWTLYLGCFSLSEEKERRWRSCLFLVGPSRGCIQNSATF